jgi:zinc protease
MKGNPGAIAGRLSSSVVYGPEHAFGRFTTEASLQGLALDDCKRFATDHVRPQGARLFVVGDITREQVQRRVSAVLGDWKGKPKTPPAVARPQPRKGRIFFVDMPGAPQSVVHVLGLGPERKAPDYYATNLMSSILGGGFSSRINMNIREKHGYAYGAGGGISYNRHGGVFTVSASVRTDVTKESIQEIWKEIRGLKDGEPTEEELAREKQGKILALPARFATGDQILDAYRELVYFGLPLGYFDGYVKNFSSVDREGVKRAAQKHLRPDELQLLVVGDGKTVLPKLEALAASDELGGGPVVILDPDGRPLSGNTAQRAAKP